MAFQAYYYEVVSKSYVALNPILGPQNGPKGNISVITNVQKISVIFELNQHNIAKAIAGYGYNNNQKCCLVVQFPFI